VIPVKQTISGGPDAPPGKRGNCFGACMASAFEVPMTQIPDPPLECDITVHDSSAWWAHYRGVAAEHGFLIETFEPMEDWWDWMGLAQMGLVWIAGVPSLNIPATELVPDPLHAVVMRDTDLIHDPSNRITYSSIDLVDIRFGHYFVSLDPARALS
jgi:hypothetical protein